MFVFVICSRGYILLKMKGNSIEIFILYQARMYEGRMMCCLIHQYTKGLFALLGHKCEWRIVFRSRKHSLINVRELYSYTERVYSSRKLMMIINCRINLPKLLRNLKILFARVSKNCVTYYLYINDILMRDYTI